MEKLYNCTICKQQKTIENYYKDCTRTSGLSSKCKTCSKQKSKEYQTKRRKDSVYRENQKKWQIGKYRRNIPMQLLIGARKRARSIGILCNIDSADIIIPEVCPILGIKMQVGTPYAASIDRIIPEKGYIKGNIMIISKKANQMKSNASIDELRKFCQNAPLIYNLTFQSTK